MSTTDLETLKAAVKNLGDKLASLESWTKFTYAEFSKSHCEYIAGVQKRLDSIEHPKGYKLVKID